MRVLAVGAHPDDLEILCAGTLARYAAGGHHVTMAVATNGDLGSTVLPKAETAALREKEARAAAQLIGADLVWMGYPDAFLFSREDTRRDFIDLLRCSRPDVILTHDPNDYHADHRTVAQLLMDVRMLAAVERIETAHPAAAGVPEIFFMDTIAGVGFQPEVYVDVSATFATKQQMLAKHESQARWLKEQYGISFLEFIELNARYRGIQSGCRYAEGFRHWRVWPGHSAVGLLP
ncbi:MAG: PIG-L deacetylase family protein [Terriglobales bacterium]